MLSDGQGWELSDFPLILKLRHYRTGIHRSECMQYATATSNYSQFGATMHAFTAAIKHTYLQQHVVTTTVNSYDV